MKKVVAFIMGLVLFGSVLWGQGLDEINVVEMSWLLKCYQGIRVGTAATAGVVTSSYSKPAFFDNLGRDEDLAKERQLIKTTFNLGNVLLISQGELWLKDNQATAMLQLIREKERPLAMEIERLDASWLHYRLTVYELDGEKKAVMRSAFTIPSTMTLKDAVVFGFEDSTGSPLFLSLRIENLYAEGKDFKKVDRATSASKEPGLARAIQEEELAQKIKDFEKGTVVCRGEVKPPRLLSAEEPAYPADAVKKGIEGTVILALKVNESGRVVDAMILRSIPELDRAALEVVKKWVYAPLVIEGKSRTCVFTSTVNFDLEKQKGRAPEAGTKDAILVPRLYSYVPPVYPEAARINRIEGTVMLSVTLSDKGDVVAARVLRSIPELDQASIDAVKQWKYEPMSVNGKPRGVVFTVSVEFKR
jgi:TonB family protein